MQPSDLVTRGEKQLLRLRLDVELFTADTLTATILGDGVVLETMPITGEGRHSESLLQFGGTANLIELRLDSAADFRLWYADISFLSMPEEGYLHQMLPTDLGWPSLKIGSWIDLDYELLEPGTLTADVQMDNVSRFTTAQTAVGRHRTGRLRLSREATGRLIGLTLSSTARFRWWGGEIVFLVVGKTAGVQRVPLKAAAAAVAKVEVLHALLASETKVEVLQAGPSPETKVEVLQAGPSSETKIEVIQAAPSQDVKIIDIGK